MKIAISNALVHYTTFTSLHPDCDESQYDMRINVLKNTVSLFAPDMLTSTENSVLETWMFLP